MAGISLPAFKLKALDTNFIIFNLLHYPSINCVHIYSSAFYPCEAVPSAPIYLKTHTLRC